MVAAIASAARCNAGRDCIALRKLARDAGACIATAAK
jgi:hypothetical protein